MTQNASLNTKYADLLKAVLEGVPPGQISLDDAGFASAHIVDSAVNGPFVVTPNGVNAIPTTNWGTKKMLVIEGDGGTRQAVNEIFCGAVWAEHLLHVTGLGERRKVDASGVTMILTSFLATATEAAAHHFIKHLKQRLSSEQWASASYSEVLPPEGYVREATEE